MYEKLLMGEKQHPAFKETKNREEMNLLIAFLKMVELLLDNETQPGDPRWLQL